MGMKKIFNKKNMQFIFGKVLIFIFCVLFMSLYNKFFDSSNSTIGIVLLTGLLMFLKNDFGFNKISAAFSIIFLYLICIIAPVLANINPILGLFINFLSIFIILVLSTKNIEQDNQLPFMLGYIFASGYVVTGDLFVKRVVSVLIIATLIAIIYLLKNMNDKNKIKIKELFKIDFNSEAVKWYLKLSITLTFVMFVGDIINYPKTLWISFTVLSLIRPTKDEYLRRVETRLLYTIIGSLTFYLLFKFLIPVEDKMIVAFVVGFAMMFIDNYNHKTMANSFNALLTATIDLTNLVAVALRIISNVIGIIVASVFQKVFEYMFRKRLSN